jgi:hypothetical protein
VFCVSEANGRTTGGQAMWAFLVVTGGTGLRYAQSDARADRSSGANFTRAENGYVAI